MNSNFAHAVGVNRSVCLCPRRVRRLVLIVRLWFHAIIANSIIQTVGTEELVALSARRATRVAKVVSTTITRFNAVIAVRIVTAIAGDAAFLAQRVVASSAQPCVIASNIATAIVALKIVPISQRCVRGSLVVGLQRLPNDQKEVKQTPLMQG